MVLAFCDDALKGLQVSWVLGGNRIIIRIYSPVNVDFDFLHTLVT